MQKNYIAPLKKPWKVGGQEATEIEVRHSTMKDVSDCEQVASVLQHNTFNMHMACLQVVRAGTFTGPFVFSHFSSMAPARFAEISAAMQEADRLGED
jgi:phage FluMu protein gp41